MPKHCIFSPGGRVGQGYILSPSFSTATVFSQLAEVTGYAVCSSFRNMGVSTQFSWVYCNFSALAEVADGDNTWLRLEVPMSTLVDMGGVFIYALASYAILLKSRIRNHLL